eukprot:TRINITY_DN35_c0_g2_i1.p1 TRINITY_DN35_c0_g2~~TRINITY_DN35_c0_g2_i1.p1  ORF type:complete len:350 (-),score=87.15 TRINITY_DN35_c0_g2_i1:1033-2082(-)
MGGLVVKQRARTAAPPAPVPRKHLSAPPHEVHSGGGRQRAATATASGAGGGARGHASADNAGALHGRGKQATYIYAGNSQPNSIHGSPSGVENQLEQIADAFIMHQQQQRGSRSPPSHHSSALGSPTSSTYGIDLTTDTADDVPVQVIRGEKPTQQQKALPKLPQPRQPPPPPQQSPLGSQREEEQDDYNDGYYTPLESQIYECPQPKTPSDAFYSVRWQKGGLIGSGGFGKVYLGMNLDTAEFFAVKQIPLVVNEESSKELESFKQEVAVMKDLQHENIVQYLGMSLEEDNLNIFMEYIPSGSIASLLRKFGKFSEPVVRVYTRQILNGLRYLHNHHIVHRGGAHTRC